MRTHHNKQRESTFCEAKLLLSTSEEEKILGWRHVIKSPTTQAFIILQEKKFIPGRT